MRALTCLALLVFVAGCYSAPVMPPLGSAYTKVQAPLDVDYNKSAVGGSGHATAQNVLGLVTWGDCSAAAAAANGGISTIDGADYEFFTILGVYQKFTTIVHGN